ncbi:nucleotide-binding domain-containing protein [Epithele typhae]|uniref:nucleotide-binding domain-containing protein n=1 Tax=Epithele typhae TaxID=378194 RepID=UPI002007D83C|nr:nucleotide-binding domain-containing protein [Epithele typhae]KAH9932019.1 nucleotide-binding domain-containing protein [Epithele typhae]
MTSAATASAPSQTIRVVVLGGGVIGLTVAHVLAQHARYAITVVARDMPDDLDSQAFASPWAGANWSPIGRPDARLYKWEKTTFDKFWDMLPSGLVLASPSRVFYGAGTKLEKTWYKDLVRDFRILEPNELPTGQACGVGFQTISVNPAQYLPWLKAELTARGVEFVRKKVHSFGEAAALAGDGAVLVNATGLGARSLVGLEDQDVYPIRGQTLVIDNPAVDEFICVELPMDSDSADATYIIPRPAPRTVTPSGRTTILGGKYERGAWDTAFAAADAAAIRARCAALLPAVAAPETRVLAHNVGLRPARKGGPRVEVERVPLPRASGAPGIALAGDPGAEGEGEVVVVHAYGFGPAGYQQSWGAAMEIEQLVESSVPSLKA